ncbi:Methionine aminopeptidase [Buchnera aphidicola (Neophyllaphis podocarpi)]|uniref:type I methionyl aminopeptidase n=1 Tax=Buchnera aphidicola TaxID=9 RepID=UPI003464DB15
MNIIKTKQEIKKMRIAGKCAAVIIDKIEKYIEPGITTERINNICNKLIMEQKAKSACLGYKGFPKSICTSVNEVVCHGIPSNKQVLKIGDIINIDITVIKNGYHGDTSKMFVVGEYNKLGKKLCEKTKKSLYEAIKIIKPGIRLNKIGKSIQNYIANTKFSIVKEYCGHGIGKFFHEYPQVLHYETHDNGLILKPGMTFTIEPMINSGKPQTKCIEDGWTVITKDKSLSAQYEHTILVTEEGCEILTLNKTDTINKIIRN